MRQQIFLSFTQLTVCQNEVADVPGRRQFQTGEIRSCQFRVPSCTHEERSITPAKTVHYSPSFARFWLGTECLKE